jgi:hypothetical protein
MGKPIDCLSQEAKMPDNWKDVSEWEQLMSEYGMAPEETFEDSSDDRSDSVSY